MNKEKSLEFSADGGIIITHVRPICRPLLISVSILWENRHAYFCFQETISFYTVMINLGISPLKGNYYRWHESQFAMTSNLSKCKHVTLLWSGSINIAVVYYRIFLHLDSLGVKQEI